MSSSRASQLNADRFEELYAVWTRREFVHPDPIEFLYRYEDPSDREIVALVASCLAYGRVAQILRSVSTVLDRMQRPAQFLADASRESLHEALGDFKHRFTTGAELADLLYGSARVIAEYGSIEACFLAGYSPEGETVLPGLSRFVEKIDGAAGQRLDFLLPSPERGSACKRLNLFMRWMVREDAVDPGGWDRVPASRLVYPLDTHIFHIGSTLGLTRRRQPNTLAALDITAAFRELAPNDPVRYDFALTRLGIRSDGNLDEFLREAAAAPCTVGAAVEGEET